MKARIVAAVGLAVVAAIVAVFGYGHHSASAGSNPVAGSFLPYEKALAAHYASAEQAQQALSHNPDHLPFCSASLFKREGGYNSAAALQAAVAAAPEKPACRSNPHDVLYGPTLNACTSGGSADPSRLHCPSANVGTAKK